MRTRLRSSAQHREERARACASRRQCVNDREGEREREAGGRRQHMRRRSAQSSENFRPWLSRAYTYSSRCSYLNNIPNSFAGCAESRRLQHSGSLKTPPPPTIPANFARPSLVHTYKHSHRPFLILVEDCTRVVAALPRTCISQYRE